jgi:hypothetical protein
MRWPFIFDHKWPFSPGANTVNSLGDLNDNVKKLVDTFSTGVYTHLNRLSS